MNCNCTWVESILAILIVVFAFWQTTYSKWIIVIAALVLLVHAMWCKSCRYCDSCMNEDVKPAKKTSKRR